MRKTLLFIVSIILIISAIIVPASADNAESLYTYTYNDCNIVFDPDGLTESQINAIINSFTNDIDENISTYNVMCTLFGHNLTDKDVTLEYHNYYPDPPHCKFEIYTVAVCDRCDYTERTWVRTEYGYCH